MPLPFDATLKQLVQLFQRVRAMRESSTYQAILDEGRQEGREMGREEGALREARRLLLLLGEHKIGPPDSSVEAAVQALDDLAHIERMSRRLFSVDSWQDLLATP